MNRRTLGLVLVVVGSILLFFAYQSSQSLGDQVTEAVTGRFTDSTTWYLILSLALAGILALVLDPVVDFLEKRLRLPRLLAVLVLVVVVVVGFVGLIVLLVPMVVSQAAQLLTVLPDTLESWQERFSSYYPEVSTMIFDSLGNNGEEEIDQPSLPGLENPGQTLMTSMGLLAGISFVPLFLYFTLLSGELLRTQAAEVLSIFSRHTRQKVMYFMDVFVEYVTAFFQGQLMIAAAMGAMFGLSFTLIGLNYGVLVGLVLGVLNIVPFLGTLIGLLVVLPMAYLQQEGGGVELLVLTGLVFAAVQLIESWLLTPKIMANRSGLHPALVVISLFFWGTVFGGIFGMVLAVPLTAFFVTIWGEIKNGLQRTLNNRDDRP